MPKTAATEIAVIGVDISKAPSRGAGSGRAVNSRTNSQSEAVPRCASRAARVHLDADKLL